MVQFIYAITAEPFLAKDVWLETLLELALSVTAAFCLIRLFFVRITPKQLGFCVVCGLTITLPLASLLYSPLLKKPFYRSQEGLFILWGYFVTSWEFFLYSFVTTVVVAGVYYHWETYRNRRNHH